MGGKIKKGYSAITGVVKDEIKDYIDGEVCKGTYKSRCEAIGCIVTRYVNTSMSNQQRMPYSAAYKPADKPIFPVIDYSIIDENYRVL